jgi:hypothetical protein
MITKEEAKQLIRDAVREVLAERPVPACVSVAEAAKLLSLSTRTVTRMNPPRVAGKVPYSWIVETLASR